MAAANRVLRGEVAARARRLAADPNEAFAFDAAGALAWHGEKVARLIPGDTALAPRIEVAAADFLDGPLRELVRKRLDDFVSATLRQALKPLFAALELEAGAAARGLLFRLGETLGTLDAVQAGPLITGLKPEDRKALTRAGIRFGTETTYVVGALKPAAVAMRALLWSIHAGAPLPPPLPPPGRLSVPTDSLGRPDYAEAIGYRVIGPRAIRVDRLEQLAAALRQRAKTVGGFPLEPALASMIGAPLAALPAIVAALGYHGSAREDGILRFAPLPRRSRRNGMSRKPAPPSRPVAPDHPFAKLKELEFNR